jgi:hypothetical protein
MNPLEDLLQDDLNRLVDRIATTTLEGTVAGCATKQPGLMSRIEQAETALAKMREGLLEGYAVWRQALDDLSDLWALADLAADRPAPGTERQAA